MATLPISLVHKPIGEKTTQKLTFSVRDEDGNPIPGASLVGLTVTLMSERDQAIINSRQDLSILNENGGTVDGSGNGTWLMDPADNAILNGARFEDHIALFEWTYGAGPKQGRQTVRLRVVNLDDVT